MSTKSPLQAENAIFFWQRHWEMYLSECTKTRHFKWKIQFVFLGGAMPPSHTHLPVGRVPPFHTLPLTSLLDLPCVPPEFQPDLRHWAWYDGLSSVCLSHLFSALFLSVASPENCWISDWSGDLVDVEDVPLGNSLHSVSVMGLVSILLHCNICNASSLVFEILKHDKMWGWQFALAFPPLQILGDSSSPVSPLIYARALSNSTRSLISALVELLCVY